MENFTTKYYCPLQVNFRGYDNYGFAENESYELPPEDAVCYANGIKRAVTACDDGNMAERFYKDESAAKKLISAYWGVEVVDGILYGCVETTLREPFTSKEDAAFKDYIEGQNSDGFGESFEQKEFKVADGWITVNYWQESNNYFVYNEREFMKHLGKKQPYAFSHKETEKCRNYWHHCNVDDRVPVAFLEFDCVDIELNLEKNSKGTKGAGLFVCKCYEGGEWESAEYATPDVQEKLRKMKSWDEVEDFMYDELIKYCEENGIDYTKSFIEENRVIKEERKMKRCPKCGNETFAVTAHVVQGWLVDSDGYYISTTEECVEVAHEPDNEDLWTCTKCHYEDVGAAFETTDRSEPKKEEAMPRIAIRADFRILKKHRNGPSGPVYLSLRKEDLDCLSPGGFTFIINEKSVPFDFDAWSCNEELGIFNYESGEAAFFNDYEISEDFDEMLAEVGLSRKDLTAEFLASASEIYEFAVNFEDRLPPVTDEGWYGSNLKGNPEFKVELLKVSFTDMESEKEYFVKDSVLDAFNKGE